MHDCVVIVSNAHMHVQYTLTHVQDNRRERKVGRDGGREAGSEGGREGGRKGVVVTPQFPTPCQVPLKSLLSLALACIFVCTFKLPINGIAYNYYNPLT